MFKLNVFKTIQKKNDFNIPVLLTSSVIAYDKRVTLNNTSERIEYTLKSITEWLDIDPHIKLVICDGSNYDFTEVISKIFPVANIECIFFENNQNNVCTMGRGFGEGEIVSHATRHSKYILNAGCFAKCTSKLWVKNYSSCIADWNGNFLCKAVFFNVFSPIQKTKLAYIDTRFYVSSLKFYEMYFERAHLNIDVNAGKGLEECFLEVIQRGKIFKIFLRTVPIIEGVGGGTGKYYKNSLKRRLKEVLRLRIVKAQQEFTNFFSK